MNLPILLASRLSRVAVLLAALHYSAASAEAMPLEISSATVQTVAHEQLFDGVVEAVNQTTVSSQTGGRAIEVLYDVDDYVTKGDIIVRLRDADQRARFEQSEASLDEAQARYAEAESEFQRIADIFEKNLVSKSQFDKAKAERDASRARLEAARAALNQAREQLEYTLVRAPYSGIVTKRHVEIGETVQVGQPVMSGVSLEKLRVNVAVPQRLINAVRTIGKARVYTGDSDELVIQASTLR